jgi:hypothetical protein
VTLHQLMELTQKLEEAVALLPELSENTSAAHQMYVLRWHQQLAALQIEVLEEIDRLVDPVEQKR